MKRPTKRVSGTTKKIRVNVPETISEAIKMFGRAKVLEMIRREAIIEAQMIARSRLK